MGLLIPIFSIEKKNRKKNKTKKLEFYNFFSLKLSWKIFILFFMLKILKNTREIEWDWEKEREKNNNRK